jgi:putative transposase
MQVDAPNQLWEMDIKYGYIAGTKEFFFQLSLIDVMDREVISYHIGLRCTARDAVNVLKQAIRKRNLDVRRAARLPVIRKRQTSRTF